MQKERERKGEKEKISKCFSSQVLHLAEVSLREQLRKLAIFSLKSYTDYLKGEDEKISIPCLSVFTYT